MGAKMEEEGSRSFPTAQNKVKSLIIKKRWAKTLFFFLLSNQTSFLIIIQNIKVLRLPIVNVSGRTIKL